MTSKPADRIGQVLLGKLEVVGLLGEGGMGAVYEVEHQLTRHRRALKVLPSSFERPEDAARFLRQASVAGTIHSPHIVETLDAGTLEDGTPYVLMEKLEGETLRDLLRREGMLDVERIAQILSQTAQGLAVAHAAGIVHRDLKPANLFLQRGDDEPVVKVLDFGISKFQDRFDAYGTLTADGEIVGTPYYMSPEQAASAKSVDARSDVYALGVILYECLCGERPFEASNLSALVIKIHRGEHVPLRERDPSIDKGIARVAARAMSKSPSDRYPDVQSLVRALDAIVDGASRRRSTPYVVAAVVAAGLFGAFSLGYLLEVPADASMDFESAYARYVEADNRGCIAGTAREQQTDRLATLRAACMLGAGQPGDARVLVRSLMDEGRISAEVVEHASPEFRALVAELDE